MDTSSEQLAIAIGKALGGGQASAYNGTSYCKSGNHLVRHAVSVHTQGPSFGLRRSYRTGRREHSTPAPSLCKLMASMISAFPLTASRSLFLRLSNSRSRSPYPYGAGNWTTTTRSLVK